MTRIIWLAARDTSQPIGLIESGDVVSGRRGEVRARISAVHVTIWRDHWMKGPLIGPLTRPLCPFDTIGGRLAPSSGDPEHSISGQYRKMASIEQTAPPMRNSGIGIELERRRMWRHRIRCPFISFPERPGHVICMPVDVMISLNSGEPMPSLLTSILIIRTPDVVHRYRWRNKRTLRMPVQARHIRWDENFGDRLSMTSRHYAWSDERLIKSYYCCSYAFIYVYVCECVCVCVCVCLCVRACVCVCYAVF